MNISSQLLTSVRSTRDCAVIDRALILDRVGGDEELLREITSIFLEEYPALIHEIELAVAAEDAKKLERAAHSLKGSVANFGAPAAVQAAYTLETLGRKGELQSATAALSELLSQFEQLAPDLELLAS